MKRKNYLVVFFCLLAIVALIALAGFMTLYVADDSNLLKQQLQKFLAPVMNTVEEETYTVETVPESTEAAVAQAHSVIFVGDSRTVGMRDAVNDNCVYLGSEGEGYNWFASEGVAYLDQDIKLNDATDVVINFGVNDPENVSLYIDLYHSLIEKYPDTSFYFLSVNPLEDSEGFNTTNEMISLFNATIAGAFPDAYLDSNSYLTETGFETTDGLHYTDDTYRKIHAFVIDQLSKKSA